MLKAPATSPFTRLQARSRTRRWAIYSFVLMASAQIAIPLSPTQESLLTGLTVMMLASTVYFFARSSLESERLRLVFALVIAISFAVEAIGWHTGRPFGRYSYTADLEPRLLGVPLVVPLAWFAMTLAARDVARRLPVPAVVRWIVGGYLLAAWDLLLDPQMTHAGFWVWHSSGGWQGIPISNYLGWLVVGSVLSALVDLVIGHEQLNDGLFLVYAWMTGFATLGFLLPFAFHRPVVSLVGAIATLPLVIVAVKRKPVEWRAFP